MIKVCTEVTNLWKFYGVKSIELNRSIASRKLVPVRFTVFFVKNKNEIVGWLVSHSNLCEAFSFRIVTVFSVSHLILFFVAGCVTLLLLCFYQPNPASKVNAEQVSGDRFSDCRLQIAGVSGHCLLSC